MPFDRTRYPPDWDDISRAIKAAAGWRCQGSPAYPDCRAEHGKPHPVTGSRVFLTTAHLDHNPQNNALENLRCWCQRCHLAYDARHHAGNAWRTRRARARLLLLAKGQLEFLPLPKTEPRGRKTA